MLAMAVLLSASSGLRAAALPEERAFQAAFNELKLGFYQQAEASFAEFAQKFPNSPLLPEAILSQAEARVNLTNYAGALELLSAHQNQAGKRADEYLFWQAEALDRKGDLQAAADTFAKLSASFPGSPRRLEAAIREATARARLAEWNKTLELLRATNGIFQASIRANVTNELVARGYLLLGEAFFRNGDIKGAESTVGPLAGMALTPDLNWRRQYLGCRILLAADRTEAALQASTNLLNLAAAAGPAAVKAESVALQAQILERLGRRGDAIAAYEKNLGPTIPSDRQKEALFKIADLALAENKLPEAAQVLEKFLQQSHGAESEQVALLSLGELRLRQYESGDTNSFAAATTNAPAVTNRLQQAFAAFQGFTNRFSQSTLGGKALLDLGWCFWLQAQREENPAQVENNLTASRAVLQAAVQRLPPSLDQATARFKLADTLFHQTNFLGAVTNYKAILEQFGSSPEVTNSLFEPALYQLVRASIAAGDLTTATNALANLLEWFPASFHTERAVLLAGQEIGQRNPSAARRLFTEFSGKVSGTTVMPQLQLAIARTHEQEFQWIEAVKLYDSWLATFTNQAAQEFQERAEYSRARANSQAGRDTNAFTQFTNFIARFPRSEFAPLAQWWLADFYFRAGDIQAAEANYQAVYQNTNWPLSELSYQARMMAGRAAFARQSWKDAKDYFAKLAGNTNCPADIRAQAFFALGDTLMSQDSTNKLADYQEALNAFDQIFYLAPSNHMTALALGEKANCLLQSAQISQDYLVVSNAFQQVIDAPGCDARARSIATVGLGVAAEKLAQHKTGDERSALLNLALAKYLDVLNDKILIGTEKFDPFWRQKAGLEAARLAESMRLRAEAIRVYELLQEIFPPLNFDGRINALKSLNKASPDKS